MFKDLTKKILEPCLRKFGYRKDPEAAICIEFAKKLAQMQMVGMTKPFVWAHVPNEYDGDNKHAFGRLMTAMGRIKGFPDYIFMSGDVCLAIEFKAKKNKLSVEQEDVSKWFKCSGVPYHICRSSDGALEVLKKHGLVY